MSSGMFRRVVCHKISDVLEELTAFITTSETSVNFYQTTRRNIPDTCHFKTIRRENLKSWTCREKLEHATSLVQP
jgi:hypothetical protein